ncbi:MAG: hypothetical protein AVDCRST_MAG57-1948 [uncultured Blastococcus sp.]|uniref:DUF1731 domain-containing protein n=1 Tax=uncultured Blastococcus sp. TaxID=217144 RepID=A0A6J4IDB1_9ACTN|nr:MAG: hypothetical protein AVDCRST_MAG57-1948 [uncultured Blastococcus sp.]
MTLSTSAHPLRGHRGPGRTARSSGTDARSAVWASSPAAPTPAPLLRLGAVLARTDPPLALTGRRAVSRRLAEAGFELRHPHLDGALTDLLVPRRR